MAISLKKGQGVSLKKEGSSLTRLTVTLGYLEQRAKPAEAAEDAFTQGLFGERFDAFDEGVAGIDIHSGITIGEGWGRMLRLLCHLEIPNEG